MPERQIDYLIVGQGLAGSLLAYSLIKNGQSVMVIDNEHKGSSSQVAAGTINPITGHRLNITEHFQRYYSAAQPFYQAIEHTLGTSIFREIPQIRLIKNAGQADYFKQRMQQAEYRGLLSKAVCRNFSSPAFGCANISQTALVDTRTLLQSMQAWLISLDAYRCRKVDYQQLRFSGTGIPYDDICAQRVVFCEGYQAINNPWLSELPFKLAKGDILTLEVNPRLTSLHNWGHWLVPATNNTAKLGASFEWQDLSLQPSTNVAEKLLSSLRQTTRITPPYQRT